MEKDKVSKYRLRYPVQKRLFRDSYITPTLKQLVSISIPVLISETRPDLLKMLSSAISKAVNEDLLSQEIHY